MTYLILTEHKTNTLICVWIIIIATPSKITNSNKIKQVFPYFSTITKKLKILCSMDDWKIILSLL